MIKKSTYIILLSILAVKVLVAQTVLQTVNLPVVGDMWVNKVITDTSIQGGAGGPNITWNFQSYFINPNTLIEKYEALTGTTDDQLFPSANLKGVSFFGGYNYYLKGTNNLQFLGTKGSSFEIYISSVENILNVPFQYGDSISNQPVTGTGILGGPLSGTIKVEADAYGTLVLFTGTYQNVLRVRTNIDVIESDGTPASNNIHIEKFTWYSTLNRAPIFEIATLELSGAIGNSRQKVITVSTLNTGIDSPVQQQKLLAVTPNPGHLKTNVSLKVSKTSEINIQVMDITGKVWMNENKMFSPALNSCDIDISALPKGIYLVSATDDNQKYMQRLIVE